MPVEKCVLKEVNDRGPFGKFWKYFFILSNVTMLVLVTNSCQQTSNGGSLAALVGIVATTTLLIFWAGSNLVLGMLVLVTRRKRLVTTDDYLHSRRLNEGQRREESLRNWVIALAAFLLYAFTAGAWLLFLLGLCAAITMIYMMLASRAERLSQANEVSVSDNEFTAPEVSTESSARTPAPSRSTFGRKAPPAAFD